MDTSKIINGTWGSLWEDGVQRAEVTAFQLKITYNYQPITSCGQMVEDRKLIGVKITGSMTLNKIGTYGDDIADAALLGHDKRRSLVGGIADPDAIGAERVSVTGVSYDETTLADWAAGKVATVTIPFQATAYNFLDKIGA